MIGDFLKNAPAASSAASFPSPVRCVSYAVVRAAARGGDIRCHRRPGLLHWTLFRINDLARVFIALFQVPPGSSQWPTFVEVGHRHVQQRRRISSSICRRSYAPASYFLFLADPGSQTSLASAVRTSPYAAIAEGRTTGYHRGASTDRVVRLCPGRAPRARARWSTSRRLAVRHPRLFRVGSAVCCDPQPRPMPSRRRRKR